VGEGFRGEPFPRIPEYIQSFTARDAGGETPVGGRPGGDPAGVARVAREGALVVAYVSHPYPTEIEADTFERYLREEGQDRVAQARRTLGRSGQPATERFSRCAKAIVRAGPAVASRGPGDPVGCPLELMADSDPVAAGPQVFRLLWRGKPLAGTQVLARPREGPEAPLAARSDREGRVRLTLDRPGVWMVKAIHMEAAPPGSGVEWESWWASLTFEAEAR
jgi:hypothetical protein